MNQHELQLKLQEAESECTSGNYSHVEKLCHEILAELSVSDQGMEPLYLIHTHALRLFSESQWRRGRVSESLPFAEDALTISKQSALPEAEAWALGNLGNVYWSMSDFQKSLDYYQDAVRLFEELSIPAGIAKYLGNIGTIERNFYDFPAALKTYRKALNLYESIGDKSGVAINLGNIGLVYKSISDYTRALEYYQKALTIYEEMDVRDGIARTLCNIGTLYRNLSEYNRALEYLQKALVICTELNDKHGVATIVTNIGNVHLSQSDYQRALKYHYQGLTINQELGVKSGIAKNLGNIGIVYSSLKNYPKALEYYQEALALNEELGRAGGVATMMSNIGALYAKKEYERYNPPLAEEYLLDAIASNEKLGTKQNLYESYLILAELYRDRNQWDKFAIYFEKYHTAEKEVQSEQSKKLAERFDYERKIEAEHARLEERERVVAELRALNTSLKEANREKNEMLGIVAHDLKNPLTGILLSAESMMRFLPQFTPKDLEKRLANIVSAAEHMKDIIMKLLDIQLLESGSFLLDTLPIDVDTHVAVSVAHYTEQAGAKNIHIQTFTPGQPSTITADKKALQEVIDNLLSNAIKFSPPDSCITITIARTSQEGVRLSIQDQGPGLSPDDQSKLFGKFMQLSAKPTGGEHSTGLGLSIVKKLVDSMGGTIWCESTSGKGATFIVEFPMFPSPLT